MTKAADNVADNGDLSRRTANVEFPVWLPTIVSLDPSSPGFKVQLLHLVGPLDSWFE